LCLQLRVLKPIDLFPLGSVKAGDMAACCLAGLWLLAGNLDESHRLSQEIETPSGSYWHGLMHRMEPDFANSKYWFRRVGRHPVFPSLLTDAPSLAASHRLDGPAAFLAATSEWDPFAFVDLCEACVKQQSSHETLCREIQRREWELLFDHCWHGAMNRS
jgi:hypothetical protein